jgi:serine protease Do
MIAVRRSTLVFLLLIAAGLGVGLGSWGAGAADPDRAGVAPAPVGDAPAPVSAAPEPVSDPQVAAEPPGVAGPARVIPAALPVPAGSLSQVAELVAPAVVNINTVTRGGGGRTPIEEFFGDEFLRRFFGDVPERDWQQRSLGSGVIVDPSGVVLTNAHVVERATDIDVVLQAGKKQKAKVVGLDRRTDLAVLRLQGTGPYPAARLGDSDRVKVGDWVLAIGSPFGLQQTVTAGIVSAKGRSIGQGAFDDFLQTDAAINPGNSGGPLVNMNGEIIGINTAILSRTGGNVGIGFSIPANMAKAIYTELVAKGKITRGWLGVSIQPLTPELAQSFGLEAPAGALIADVVQDSPAARAGIAAGDIIVEFDGKKVATPQDLQKIVAATAPGKGVPLRVWRNKASHAFEIKIGEIPEDNVAARPHGPTPGALGLDVRPVTPDVARQLNLRSLEGVLVLRVEDDSPAAEADVRRGDVILEVNRQRVRTLRDFERLSRDIKAGDQVTMFIQRGPQSLYVAFTVARG